MFTTEIYFIAMSFSLFLFPIVFIYTLDSFLQKQNKFNFKDIFMPKYLILLIIAFLLPLIWQFIPHAILKTREVNFVQHAIGGGFAVAVGCIYIILYYKNRYPIFKNSLFQLLFIYFTVSAFGVLNEILEFTLDFLNLGIFSADRYDTWYDMVANTSGAFAAFTLFMICNFIFFAIKSICKMLSK